MRKSFKVLGIVLIVFAVMFGIGIIINQAQESAELDRARSRAEAAKEECMANEKLMDLNEHLIGLKKGDLAELKQKAADLPKRCNNL